MVAPLLLLSFSLLGVPGLSDFMWPRDLCAFLDSWGPSLRSRVHDAIQSASSFAFQMKGGKLPGQDMPLRVGTDCSGLESPIHALKAMGLDHRHLFSCECGPAARKVIRANSPPWHGLYDDVTECETHDAPFVDLYIAGFSCKPFSMLHVNTKLLNEDQAKIFFSVLQRIRLLKPPAFVLENVEGIKRCMDAVLSLLRDAGYFVAVLLLNPFDLGEPVNRPRFYFVGFRTDIAIVGEKAAQNIYERVWESLTRSCGPAVPLTQRILPLEHPAVLEHQQLRCQKWKQAKAAGFPAGREGFDKWKQRHEEWTAHHPGQEKVLHPHLADPDELFLHLPRERDVWEKLMRDPNTPKKAVADLSQNLGRVPIRSDSVPTITPGSHIVLSEARRMLAPMEKLLLHCLPVHTMCFDDISNSDLEDMGGNMMHLQTVGVAMLMAISFVDWDNPLARVAVPTVHAIPSFQAGTSKRKAKSRADKRMDAKLRARFGLSPSPLSGTRGRRHATKSNRQVKLKNQKPKANSVKLPAYKACLCGTRWAG